MKKITVALIIFIVLIVLYDTAVAGNWFWLYPWIDIPLHILGGGFVASVWLWLCDVRGREQRYHRLHMTMIAVLLVGGAWEIFEYALTHYDPELIPGFTFYTVDPIDIIGDLISDIFGAILIFSLITKYTVRRPRR